jgi:hypothetical protein
MQIHDCDDKDRIFNIAVLVRQLLRLPCQPGSLSKRRKPIISKQPNFNPLNAELNPICHLLILLGDLTFMGKCMVSISNKMQRYTVYLYLETALHVSGGTSTHHQERIHCIYSIWYLSHRYCYLPLSWKSWNRFECAVGGVSRQP